MTDLPTPESDEAHRLNCLPSTTPEMAYHYVLNLSRQLERERDEARDAAEKTKSFKRVMKEDNAKLRRELDELNKRLIEACQRSVDLLIERDEARAETNRIRDFMDKGFARAKEELDDTRNLLREIFNITQIGDPHPADLPMKALQAIAGFIDEQWKEARK